MTQQLYTSQTPVVTNASDGTPGITTATTLNFLVAGSITHVRFFATTTVGGTYTVAIWEVTAADPAAGTLLSSKVMVGSPTPGTWNNVALDSPVPVTAGKYYRVAVHNDQGRYVATNNFFLTVVTNGDVIGESSTANPFGNFSQGAFTINASLTYPSSEGAATSYFVDALFESGNIPVSSGLDLRWRVSTSVSSALDVRWAVRTAVSKTLDLRWAALALAAASADLRWAVAASLGGVSGTLDLRWRVSGRVSAGLTLRWAVESDNVPYVPPPVLTPRLRRTELRVQRKNTVAFINADPYAISLQREIRFLNAAGGISRGDTTEIPAQIFRLLPQEDGATERVTAEGERATPEYMLMGTYDCDMQRFDTFTYDGRRYQIVWISENRQYEIKGEVVHLGE